MKRIPVTAKPMVQPRAKPKPRPAQLTMKAVSRRLMQDLATIYNWKNRKKDPLPITLVQDVMMVDEEELKGWLVDNEPNLVLTWNATAEMDEEELKQAQASMNKADVLLMGIRKIVGETRA